MTEEGYFNVKDDDQTKIVILKDAMYRIKCQLWCYHANSYYSHCYLRVDGGNRVDSYYQNKSAGDGNHYATHHFDIVLNLVANQTVSFYVDPGVLNGGQTGNFVHIEKL